jgi:predicted nucleic acid-binding protein
MLAIDTNVIVRFLTGDDPAQASTTRTLIEGQDTFVASTVMLEADWVLRSAYGLDKGDVIAALRSFAGLPRVTLEDPERILRALAWADQGLDFADALHLSTAEACEALVTFDRQFASAAARVGGSPVRVL